MNIFGKLPSSRKSDRKKEKSMVSFTQGKYIICNQKQSNDIAHEQTIICMSRDGLSTNEKKENLPWMNKNVVCYKCSGILFFINFDLQFSLCASIWFS